MINRLKNLVLVFVLVTAGTLAVLGNQVPSKVSAQTTQKLTIQYENNFAKGKVMSNPAGIDCGMGASQCEAYFDEGTIVTLTGHPKNGDISILWGNLPAAQMGHLVPCQREPKLPYYLSNTCIFTIPTDKETVVYGGAYHNKAKVTVIKTGTGNGKVTTEPAGINCGNVCSATFPVAFGQNNHEAEVRLYAKPDPGSVFVGWDRGTDEIWPICYFLSDPAVTASPGCHWWIRGDSPSIAKPIFNKAGGAEPTTTQTATRETPTEEEQVSESKPGTNTPDNTELGREPTKTILPIAGIVVFLAGLIYGYLFKFKRSILPRFLGGNKPAKLPAKKRRK